MGPLTPAELWTGKQDREDPLRRDYLTMTAAKVRRALDGQLSSKFRDEAQVLLLRNVLSGIETMREELCAK